MILVDLRTYRLPQAAAVPTTVIPTTGQWAIGLISVFRDHGRKQLSAPFPESRHFALYRQQVFRQLCYSNKCYIGWQWCSFFFPCLSYHVSPPLRAASNEKRLMFCSKWIIRTFLQLLSDNWRIIGIGTCHSLTRKKKNILMCNAEWIDLHSDSHI